MNLQRLCQLKILALKSHYNFLIMLLIIALDIMICLILSLSQDLYFFRVLISNLNLNKNFPKSLLDLQIEYFTFLNKNNLDPIKFSISYILRSNLTNFFLIGVNNSKQLKDIINKGI